MSIIRTLRTSLIMIQLRTGKIARRVCSVIHL
jgi:hypothetical protein